MTNRIEEMRVHLAELRETHENAAARQTVYTFIATGEKTDTNLNWLMAAAGGVLVLLVTQWTAVIGVIGRPYAGANVLLLLLGLLIGVVAKFEIQQAQLVSNMWQAQSAALQASHQRYIDHVTQYLGTVTRAAGQAQIPTPDELRMTEIGAGVHRMMPPDFNSGWRRPIWRSMEIVAFLLTGRGPTENSVGRTSFGIAQAAYRVGSSMFLVIFIQFIMMLTAAVAVVGLLTR